MPKMPVLAAVVLAMLSSSAGPSLGQPGQEEVPLVAGSAADGSPYILPPDYVTEDGLFATGGDVFIECASIGADDLPSQLPPKDLAQYKRQLEENRQLCREAGFEPAPKSALTDGLDPSANQDVFPGTSDAPGGTGFMDDPDAGGVDAADDATLLPNTGGSPLSLVFAGLLAAGAGLAACLRTR